MFFKRSVQRYGRTPEPETPYQRAGQLWDERIGSARVQAKSWRLTAFGGLALTAAMATALVWQSQQSRVVPYVVEVDRLGEARAVQPADRDYRPDDAQIAWHLARFIEHVRTVSLDPVLMRRDWLSAYDFVTARGSRFLTAYARSARPFDAIGEKTVSVEVTSVVRASDRSFQVEWTETAFDHGEESGTSHWTAILSVIRHSPATADVLRRNPLGIYVHAIDWSREFEPTEAPPPEPAQNVSPPEADAGAPTAPGDRGAASVSSATLAPESRP
jgi:type IV secretion system protein VirB5